MPGWAMKKPAMSWQDRSQDQRLVAGPLAWVATGNGMAWQDRMQDQVLGAGPPAWVTTEYQAEVGWGVRCLSDSESASYVG